MTDGGRAVGFIGLLFSRRFIGQREEKFCNLTSWIVEEKWRTKSLSLLFPIFSLKGYTITVFTASDITRSVLKGFGYRCAVSKRGLIPAFPVGPSVGGRFSLSFGEDAKDRLDERDLKIYSDHLKFKSLNVVIESGNSPCYIVLKRSVRKALPFAQVHYVGNPDIFSKYIASAAAGICSRFKVLGLIVDERCLKGRGLPRSIPLRPTGPILYKSDSLREHNIDTLYSEMFVLEM